MLTSLIPIPYRLLAFALLSTALVFFGWVQGADHVQEKWDAQISRQALQVANIQKKQVEATTQVGNRYVDRIKVVRENGDAILKEVPDYVSAKADNACVLPHGFVRLHDAAATGRFFNASGDPDETPAGIALSTVASTITSNYERCHENAEQLTALQAWIRKVKVGTAVMKPYAALPHPC